jgi:hypothetical protein
MIKDTKVTYQSQEGTVIDDHIMMDGATGDNFQASTVQFADRIERINDDLLTVVIESFNKFNAYTETPAVDAKVEVIK